jgi:hypothetical protein
MELKMAMFTVQQGKRYSATISLGFFERFASNDTIAAKLRDAGFYEVQVTGSGGTRYAEALWPAADTSAEMPSQVTSVSEVPAPSSSA